VPQSLVVGDRVPVDVSTTVRVGPQKASQPNGGVRSWLLYDQPEDLEGPHAPEQGAHKHPWWQVMCLTGVDYFSTLGYQPGIAALAAASLAPVATLVLVLVTLLGALPMYRRVAAESPHGDGSISMLERLLSWWQGKMLVLVLISFVLTAFVVTITISASDAAAHITENPFGRVLASHEIPITLGLILLLGLFFLRGFSEAIGVAVGIVALYLALNVIVLARAYWEIGLHPALLDTWRDALQVEYRSPVAMALTAIFLFPRLALGLSGFETGVVVMPLIRGCPTDDPRHPACRIRNTGKLLTVAASIMSVLLLSSSLVATLLIPHEAFAEGGEANGRALAFLAHEYLGDGFGTVYDVSTILILWFAGASAMAGLLNIVPRYLPRYGMAPDWARAVRPLVLVYVVISVVVTIIFGADVDAQAGAYATGVLAMMTSAAFAVTLSAHLRGWRLWTLVFGLVTAVFVYALVANEVQRPDGLMISSFFIVAIVVVSLVSRIYRSLELRQERIEIDETAQRFINEAGGSDIHLVAHRRRNGTKEEYARKEKEQREDNHIPTGEPILFLEVQVEDASEFEDVLEVKGVEVGGHKVLRAQSSVVPNAIAALLLHLRDTTDKTPHCYFGWTEGNPIVYLLRFLLFGEGDTAPVTHEVLREAEPNSELRPAIHVGGR
jgi:hypothetical protein